MNITEFSSHGRTLMVEFKCRRCKTTALRPFEDCVSKDYRGLYDCEPPKEWRDGGFYYPLFCPECHEAYKRFMNMECDT